MNMHNTLAYVIVFKDFDPVITSIKHFFVKYTLKMYTHS